MTRRGEALAAIVSMEELKLLQEIEEQMDIEDAVQARNEPGKSISGEKLREELDICSTDTGKMFIGISPKIGPN